MNDLEPLHLLLWTICLRQHGSRHSFFSTLVLWAFWELRQRRHVQYTILDTYIPSIAIARHLAQAPLL